MRAQLCDVGGGTGHFTADLARVNDLGRTLVVEPSLSMVNGARARGLDTVHGDALAWAARDADDGPRFSAVMLKEVIHHIPLVEHVDMWRSIMRKHLAADGR